MPLFFWFDLFLEASADILEKNIVAFLVAKMAPKRHSEIDWPLGPQSLDFGPDMDLVNKNFYLAPDLKKVRTKKLQMIKKINLAPCFGLFLMASFFSQNNGARVQTKVE